MQEKANRAKLSCFDWKKGNGAKLRAKVGVVVLHELALHGLEVLLGPALLAIFAVRLERGGNVVADGSELLARLHRHHLLPARALQVKEVVPRLMDRPAAHDNAVALVEKHSLALHRLRNARPLAIVQDEPVIHRVVGNVIVESQAVLVAHLQLHILEAAKRSSPLLVRVEHAHVLHRIRHMNALVNEKRRSVHLTLALKHVTFRVQQQQVRRSHF
mmetsp:Transcript_3541/g.12713  ORF Transcript_3541/g.12713 Transcript_3541/m.12713 type:complete len:216 (-) Transcript_3541:216-863(-)